MNKRIKACSIVMIVVMLMTLVSCGKNAGEKAQKRSGENGATPTVTAANSSPSATPTEAPTNTPTPTEVLPTPTPTGFWAPEKGCAIAFSEGERYHYDMNLVLDTKADTVSGHVVFDFWNDSEDAWDKLCLRDYSSVFLDGKVAGYDSKTVNAHAALTEISGIIDGRDKSELSFTRDTDVSVVWIPLAKPLAPGEKMTLTYDFTAKIPTLADRYGVYEGIYNVSNFYPVLAEYVNGAWSHEKFIAAGECFFSEIADFDVRITVPEGFLLASSGTEKGKEEKDGKLVYTLDAPCIRSFVFCASDCFAVKDATYDGVHVNVFYNGRKVPAKDMDTCVDQTLTCARDSLAAFGEAFGRYPYEELDIVYAPIDAGGMEYPNLVIITTLYCDPIVRGPEDAPIYSYEEMKICVAHEIGHQWFMGIVGSNSGLEPWLDESLTSYTEHVYEDYLGIKVTGPIVDLWSLEQRTTEEILSNWEQSGLLPLTQSYYDFKNDYKYVACIYETGRRALQKVEETLGKDLWYSILRAYVHRNAFRNATTQDFLDVLLSAVDMNNPEVNVVITKVFGL